MQEIKVQSRADIASIIQEARRSKGWTRHKLTREIGLIRGKTTGTHQINRLEGIDSASYQIDLLLEAAYLLDLEIIIRYKSE